MTQATNTTSSREDVKDEFSILIKKVNVLKKNCIVYLRINTMITNNGKESHKF